MFLTIIARAKKKYRFKLKNFCIMNNHFHFIIKPARGTSLSKIMQWILSVFAMAWNKKHNHSGHVWGERFFSRIIEGTQDMLHTIMYIDENPIRAGLVSYPWNWRFGGLWHHRKKIFTIVEKPDELISYGCPDHLPN